MNKDLHYIPDDQFLNYIKEETGSNSFCLAKWYNATIWLGSGMTTSCHHPLPHFVPPEDAIKNPKAIHNTAQKKQERLMMQRGERPSGCDYCWKIEDMPGDNVSDRVYKTKIYSKDDLIIAKDTNSQLDVDLRTLEIAFDRTCNLACSYCNPAFSTSWVKDIKTNGPYTNLISDGRNHFTHTHDSAQRYARDETNPYVEAFFKWWDSDLKDTLSELRITGGEPLASDHIWRLLDNWDSNTPTRLAINSNLCVKDSLINKLLDAAKNISNLEVYTSCEALAARSEYIRDGFVWEVWYSNLIKLLESPDVKAVHIMSTVNALCIVDLPDFIEFVCLLKQKYSKLNFTLNILRFPSFQSVNVLPEKIRLEYAIRLDAVVESLATALSGMEKNQIQRLSSYLRNESGSGLELGKELHDFKKFYDQYDIRRNKDFSKTFVQLAEWYSTL
jgi:organic radical activating enzyme